MLVSNILRSLPSNLEWMVLFNLPAVCQIAGEEVTKAMYFLPENTELEQYSHVVLSSQGRYLASVNDFLLIDAISGNSLVTPEANNSLACRFSQQLDLFDVDSADCLGLGEQSPYPPVLLHLTLENGWGKATAVFDREPSFNHYELLRAVGVTFKGGEALDDYYIARFENRLPTHIHAGILSHFTRTANCNLFFLQQGNIDSLLESGLLQAASKRIEWGKNLATLALEKLATDACQQPIAMTCFPPYPQQPFPYGDLVPLGFVIKGLKSTRASNSYQQLEQYLLAKRQDKLWAFASNRLITATDSALILQELDSNDSIEALEQFSDGKGGYYPQLWSEFSEANKMLFDDNCSHWCQTDYATTCLIKALRRQAGLSEKTPVEFLTAGMSTRSGLFFANPYLVDYFLALAIEGDDSALDLRQELLQEVLASRNEDFSFGTFDRAFSTSLAILTITTLGYRGRALLASQLKLLEFIKPDGKFHLAVPFYSTLKYKNASQSSLRNSLLKANILNFLVNGLKENQNITICGEKHDISLYLDTHKMIGTALGSSALAVNSNLEPNNLINLPSIDPHPRYCCRQRTEYIANFALPPYLEKRSTLLI